VGLSSTWRLPIYTTHFNAWMLKNKFRVMYNAFSVSFNFLKELCSGGEVPVACIKLDWLCVKWFRHACCKLWKEIHWYY